MSGHDPSKELYSDKLPSCPFTTKLSSLQNGFGISTWQKLLVLYVGSNITSVNELKSYLQQNPITVQYRLETPIVHKIHIPMKNELNQTIAKPN